MFAADPVESDEAVEQSEDQKPMRITRITLRPRIIVAAGADLDRVRRLVTQAHDGCFIANTLNAEVVIDPVIAYADENATISRGPA